MINLFTTIALCGFMACPCSLQEKPHLNAVYNDTGTNPTYSFSWAELATETGYNWLNENFPTINSPYTCYNTSAYPLAYASSCNVSTISRNSSGQFSFYITGYAQGSSFSFYITIAKDSVSNSYSVFNSKSFTTNIGDTGFTTSIIYGNVNAPQFYSKIESLYDAIVNYPSNQYYNGYGAGYNAGYDYGYRNGQSDGEDVGYETGFNTGKQEGYQDGYTDGLTDGTNQDQTALTIFTGILEVGLLPINVFLSIFNYEIFGINLAGIVSAFLTITIIVILIKIITGSGGGRDKEQ